MGKPTGFLEYERKNNQEIKPLERIKNFNEFHVPMSEEERSEQAARCMDCGVPFCQSGMMIGGMAKRLSVEQLSVRSGMIWLYLVTDTNRHLADCLRQIIFRNLLPVSVHLLVRLHVPVD